jgi:hypothetical protein
LPVDNNVRLLLLSETDPSLFSISELTFVITILKAIEMVDFSAEQPLKEQSKLDSY